MPNRIQTYTITATTMIATSNGDGKIEYNATTAPPNITPDSQGKWCLYEDHIAALVRQGDELALLRLQLAEYDDKILQIEHGYNRVIQERDEIIADLHKQLRDKRKDNE